MDKKRVSVMLHGRSYAVITTDDEEYVRSVAKEVEDAMLQASRSMVQLDARDCAILTALDFCDDRNKALKKNRELVEKADTIIAKSGDLSRQCREYKERLADAINENTNLTRKLKALEEQLRTVSRENERLKKNADSKHADSERKFERAVAEKKGEQMMGYVPMRQYSLFEEEPPKGQPEPIGSMKYQAPKKDKP